MDPVQPANDPELELRVRIQERMLQEMSTGFMLMHLEQHDNPAALRLIDTNPAQDLNSGFQVSEEKGKLAHEIYDNALESGLSALYAKVAQHGEDLDLGEIEYSDERVEKAFFKVRAFQPAPDYVCVFVDNITARKAAEAAVAQTLIQEQIIATQQNTLAELSTPLIPLADGLLVMPLIGTIDSKRAQQIIESLLTGVAEARAKTVIIDITGVAVVDTQVANTLLRAAQAVKLLGANVMLTGIRPEVAQTLVSLGLDLGGIATRGTLQSGVAEAFKQHLHS
jgi:anti-anti-sigma regulatory factor